MRRIIKAGEYATTETMLSLDEDVKYSIRKILENKYILGGSFDHYIPSGSHESCLVVDSYLNTDPSQLDALLTSLIEEINTLNDSDLTVEYLKGIIYTVSTYHRQLQLLKLNLKPEPYNVWLVSIEGIIHAVSGILEDITINKFGLSKNWGVGHLPEFTNVSKRRNGLPSTLIMQAVSKNPWTDVVLDDYLEVVEVIGGRDVFVPNAFASYAVTLEASEIFHPKYMEVLAASGINI